MKPHAPHPWVPAKNRVSVAEQHRPVDHKARAAELYGADRARPALAKPGSVRPVAVPEWHKR